MTGRQMAQRREHRGPRGRTPAARVAVLFAALGCAFAAVASPESASKTAVAFARSWNPDASLRTVSATASRTASGRTFHQIDFAEGGFAIVDDASSSVTAFSTSGSAGDGSGPLWAFVRRDAALRAEAPASARSGDTAQPVTGVSAVRVAPLVKSKWGQSTAGGSPCYNLFTPSKYVCGCVATAMAQVMRFHQYPSADVAVPANTYSCKSNDVSVTLAMAGGPYDWDSMPLEPGASASTLERQAIGKLCSDAGIAMHMQYSPSGSGSELAPVVSPMKELFGYACARACFETGTGSLDAETVRAAVYPSLDAGYPVILGIIELKDGDKYNGHAVVADGYGYSGGTLYTHLNMGWSGQNDVWYALPEIPAGRYTFTIVNTIVYNIFPRDAGEIVSGRITDSYGEPVEGATVTAVRGSFSAAASTDDHGIYALILPGGEDSYLKYSLSAEKAGLRGASSAVPVRGSTDFTSLANNPDDFEMEHSDERHCGNVWGMDFILSSAETTSRRIWVSNSGSDENTGVRDEPLATIAAAMAAANDGDRIIVAPGVYAPFTSAGRLVTVEAEQGPSNTVIDACWESSCFEDTSGSTNTAVRGFTLRRGYARESGGGVYGGTFENCVIEDCRSDRYGGGACASALYGCILTGNSAYGCGAADSCILANCTVAGNDADTISGGLGYGCSAADSIIVDNTIGRKEEANYPEDISQDGSFTNCCTRPIPSIGGGCFDGDPRIVDWCNGDWRLRTGSPCIVANGRDIGAVEGDPVPGHVVSVSTYRGGSADVTTALVDDGARVAVNFSGRELVSLYTNEVEIAPVNPLVLDGITSDFCIDAVFSNVTLHVSASGSDSNGGLSHDDALATIQRAVDVSAGGDKILVHPGTYPRFSAVGKPLYIVSADGPQSTTISAGNENRAVYLDFCGGMASVLEGFTVSEGSSKNGGGVYGGYILRCIVRGNFAGESGGGLYGVTAYSTLIVDNMAGNVSIAKSYGGGASESELYNCTVAQNMTAASGKLHGSGVYNCWLLNSIVFCKDSIGDCSGEELNSGVIGISNSFVGIDPGFADVENQDFSLTAGSCAIDAGADEYAANELDLAGTPRIQRSAIDAGCFEFPCPIWITPEETSASSARHSGTLLVRAFDDWTIECDSTWLSLEKTAGSGTAEVRYCIEANRTGERRFACVTATDSGRNQADALLEQIEAVPYAEWHGGHARYGLFVGVNEYRTSLVPRSNWLTGCVADATSLLAAFTSPRGFWQTENCTLLTNAAATCAAVRGALTNLASIAQSGDTVLYTHSSHGLAEASGSLDASLLCHDGFYSDADLAGDLSLFREGVKVVVIIDACNSAGMFKDEYKPSATSFLLAENVAAIMESDSAAKHLTAALLGASAPATAEIGWITAADYNQYSWDSPDAAGGMFTSALIEGWQSGFADADNNGFLDFLELFEYAAANADGRNGVATDAQYRNGALLLRTIAGRADRGFRFILR